MRSLKTDFLKKYWKYFSLVASSVLLLVFTSQTTFAAASLSKMRIGQTSDKTRVVFDLKDAYKYELTELANPSRLVIDFFNTNNNLSFSKKHITDARLFKIRVSKNGKRTRVVLDLHKSPKYKSFLLSKNNQGSDRLVVDLFDANSMQKKPLENKPVENKVFAKGFNTEKMPTVKPVKDASGIKLNQKDANTSAKKEHAKAIATLATKNKTAQAPINVSKQMLQSSEKKNVTNEALGITLPADLSIKPSTEPNKLAELRSEKPTEQNGVSKNQKLLSNKTLEAKKVPAKTKPLVVLNKENTPQKGLNKATQKLLNKDSDVLQKPAELVVAIDAGHGGKDTGAIGHNKVYEKQATLMMAKELKKIIDQQPGMKGVLTRDRDVFLKLSQRVQIAKKHHADIFISIHADAFHDHSVRGGSVYVLSERGASSAMAKLLAASENAALDEVKLSDLDKDVAFALSDMSREANVKASRKLAKTVLKEMRKTVRMHKKSVQSAGFAVLKSIDMPSLLIETAFISNPYEAKNLMSRKFQQKMASAIVDGLKRYSKEIAPKQRWGETLYVEYRVQKGDTLSQIAESYQVSMQKLKKINNISNANSLYVGKKLKIPATTNILAGIAY